MGQVEIFIEFKAPFPFLQQYAGYSWPSDNLVMLYYFTVRVIKSKWLKASPDPLLTKVPSISLCHTLSQESSMAVKILGHAVFLTSGINCPICNMMSQLFYSLLKYANIFMYTVWFNRCFMTVWFLDLWCTQESWSLSVEQLQPKWRVECTIFTSKSAWWPSQMSRPS